MKLVRMLVLAAVAVASIAAFAAPASADVAGCQDQIGALRGLTESTATFTNPTRDQASLVAKLDAASAKLEDGKVDDAILKLTDFRGRVTQLAATGKVGAAEGAALIAGADAAITCLTE